MRTQGVGLVSRKGATRRRWPRLDAGGRLSATIAALDLDMRVGDVSLGGFSVDSPIRFVVGERHEFQLTLPDGRALTVRARAAHTEPIHGRGGADPIFRTGWEALGDPATAAAMAQVVDLIAVPERPAGDP